MIETGQLTTTAGSKKPGQNKFMPSFGTTAPEDPNMDLNEQFGFGGEKSKCLLLPSQLETMKEEYEKLDKYNDQILRRQDLIMALRTIPRIVDFIDVDAVKVASAKTKILTLD